MELQLSRVDDLDLGDFNGDDDAAGGDCWLVGESNDRVALISKILVNTGQMRSYIMINQIYLVPRRQPFAHVVSAVFESAQ